jgi:hypothetical protein
MTDRPDIEFVRLSDIPRAEINAHMTDPRVGRHLPLLAGRWDQAACDAFLAAKQACWDRDGLGHWAILCDGTYAGWGGFQKEDGEWDFGLVLKPSHFGLGARIARKALAFARADERIPYVTLLLAPSRRNLRGLDRLGARPVGEAVHEGQRFLKFQLDTA